MCPVALILLSTNTEMYSLLMDRVLSLSITCLLLSKVDSGTPSLSQEMASCAPDAWHGRLALVRIGKVWFTGPKMAVRTLKLEEVKLMLSFHKDDLFLVERMEYRIRFNATPGFYFSKLGFGWGSIPIQDGVLFFKVNWTKLYWM